VHVQEQELMLAVIIHDCSEHRHSHGRVSAAQPWFAQQSGVPCDAQEAFAARVELVQIAALRGSRKAVQKC
jgi:hypothetical protein